MRTLEEILESVLEAEAGKLADAVNEALKEIGASSLFAYQASGVLGAAIGNLDKRVQRLEEIETARQQATPEMYTATEILKQAGQ
jgi:hypothetical protein